MSFPLYDSLVQNLPAKDLTTAQISEFMEKVQNIDEPGAELVYALVQYYNIMNCDEELGTSLPYKGIYEEGKKGKGNLTWSFADFPQNLRHILYKFVCMHTRSMEEDIMRAKLTASATPT
jgi:hypothetical protein